MTMETFDVSMLWPFGLRRHVQTHGKIILPFSSEQKRRLSCRWTEYAHSNRLFTNLTSRCHQSRVSYCVTNSPRKPQISV